MPMTYMIIFKRITFIVPLFIKKTKETSLFELNNSYKSPEVTSYDACSTNSPIRYISKREHSNNKKKHVYNNMDKTI